MPLPFAGLGVRLASSAISSALPSSGGPRGFKISCETDIRAAQRMLKRVGERNIPMALAQSLTGTAKHLQKVQKRSLRKYLDNPTPFTEKAMGLNMADWKDFKRGTMFARVFVYRVQSRYLEYQVYGGRRTPKKRANVVPGKNAPVNKFGNLTRKFIKNQVAKPNTYVGKINGVYGLWQRFKSGRQKLLVLFTPKGDYQPRYPFFRISDRIVARELPKQINKAVRRALNARSRGK
jgi:hypothetical protein